MLRVYEGCARNYIGSVDGANLIKLHRFSGKVSYLACPDFETDPHPMTTETTKVWLRTLRVDFYETRSRPNPPLLDRKEQMLDSQDQRRAKFERLTKQESKHGLLDDGADCLSRGVWESNLTAFGFEHRGHRLVRRTPDVGKRKMVLPQRCGRYGVGKRIGGAIYLHRRYEHVLGPVLEVAKARLPAGFQYTVVKHNEQNGNVSFIHCPDFDTAHEPATGDYAVVRRDGSVSLHVSLADPYIYHHKWLFVRDDYGGFDLAASQARSLAWMSLSDVDKSLIGRASYWKRHVVPRLQTPPLDQQRSVSPVPR